MKTIRIELRKWEKINVWFLFYEDKWSTNLACCNFSPGILCLHMIEILKIIRLPRSWKRSRAVPGILDPVFSSGLRPSWLRADAIVCKKTVLLSAHRLYPSFFRQPSLLCHLTLASISVQPASRFFAAWLKTQGDFAIVKDTYTIWDGTDSRWEN